MELSVDEAHPQSTPHSESHIKTSESGKQLFSPSCWQALCALSQSYRHCLHQPLGFDFRTGYIQLQQVIIFILKLGYKRNSIYFWNSLNQVKCDSKSPFHWVHWQLNHNPYWVLAQSWFVSGTWVPIAHRPHCPRLHGPFRSGDSGISVPLLGHENRWRAGGFCTWSSSLC